MRAPDPETLRSLLHDLCAHPDRHVGGPGNRAACELFRRHAERAGFGVDVRELPCLVWERGDALLRAGDEAVPLHPGPYSPPCDAVAPLSAAGTLEELERGGHEGRILLLHGDLVTEQLMPRSFPFYNPEAHRRIGAALEAARPVAVIAATGQNPELAGGPYPFPLIADGDFPLPSAFLKDVEGARLLPRAGERLALRIASERRPATTPQVTARRPGRSGRRIVCFAHVDSQYGTPGALDNAAGVTVLLGLLERLAGYRGPHALELVPLNGEDDFAIPGQRDWLARNEGRLEDILLGMNVDGAGFAGHPTAVSFYGCPPRIQAAATAAMAPLGLVEGPPWPQGDHSILALHGVPALAVTSTGAFFVASTVAHTERDVPALVDPEALARVVRFFADVIERLGDASA